MLSYWTAPEFDPHITICRTILAEIKTITPIPEYFEHVGSLSELVEELFAHVREVEILTNRTPRELLDELELTISTYAYICVQDLHRKPAPGSQYRILYLE